MYILQINSDKMIGCHQRQIKEFMKSQIIPIALGNRKRKRVISTCQNRNRRLGCRQISALSSRMRFHDVRKIVGKIWIRFRRSRGSRRGNRGWFRPRVSQLVWTSLESETTIYSDRLTKHHPPISDAFVNKEYFCCIIQMNQLTHYWEKACSISLSKIPIVFHCYKKHLKWGVEVMKRVSPIILQCSMLEWIE